MVISMIIAIENTKGETIGAVQLIETDDGISVGVRDGKISIADIDYDDIFETDEKKVRIQLEE